MNTLRKILWPRDTSWPFWFATTSMFMNVFSQCEYLKAIIMYALNSHQKEGGPYENDSIIFMSTELFFPTRQNTDMKS